MPSNSDSDGKVRTHTRPWSRITPRTCLWPLVGSLLGTFGLSLGLTFRSNHYCYAGTCGEWLFPLQARLHVVVWYVWLSTTVTFLAIRAFHPQMQKVLAKPFIHIKMPLMDRKPTNGATLMLLWIVTLYAVIVGIWWVRLHNYFAERTASAQINTGGAPGLAMWCLDWSMRLHELKSILPGKVASLGRGWYTVTAPIPRSRLAGCSCRSPLAHFFIHHGDSSKREVHPFTTITHLATIDATTPADTDQIMIQFLFRKAGSTKVLEKPEIPKPWLPYLRPSRGTKATSMEWTEKLANSIDRKGKEPDSNGAERQDPEENSSSDVSLRLEGPYFSPADPSRYNTVVCLVAGTGISGAIAIAGGFNAVTRSRVRVGSISSNTTRTSSPWSRCVIAWSVRERDYIDPPGLDVCPGLELRTCLTGPGRPRQDVKKIMEEVQADADPEAKMWVYISGPKGFIENAKTVCKTMLHVDYYAASWDI
ncbi:MAG: hypothetical protein Q9174_002425 [Haloplaca sp. 1 TL-2023]